MEGYCDRELSSDGIRRSSRSIGDSTEIEVETPVTAASEDKVHVAVAAEVKAGKATLSWAINNNSRNITFVLVHVHVPAQMIPIMGGMFHVSTLSGEQINVYRQLERDKIEETLDEYLALCSQLKVRAEKLVIERDDMARGLIELVAEFGITKLVMEGALDKCNSKKMEMLKYKTAINLMEHVDPSCKIWFVFKGNLICTREASVHASRVERVSDRCKHLRSSFSPSRKNDSLNFLYSPSQKPYNQSAFNLLNTPNQDTEISMTGSSTDECKGSSRTPRSSDNFSASVIDEALSSYRSVSSSNDVNSEDRSVSSCPLQDSEDRRELPSLEHELQDLDSDTDVFTKFQATLKEVESLKHEAYEESCKRRRAEMQLILSRQQAKATENLYAREVRYRKEIEEALDREKLEVEKLKDQQAALLEQLQDAIDKKVEVELKLAESDETCKDFEEKLSGACYRLNSLQDEKYELQRERDDLVKEVEVLRQPSVTSSSYYWPFQKEYSYMEVKQATQNFSNSLEIGEDAFGKVYKGFLRNTTVAIRILNSRILQGQAEFYQEVNVISRMKHPNIVTLIGACFDALALIYEFLPNGSIEDYLTNEYSNLILTWKIRIRIIAEICSALIFLHSNRSHPEVHGDLKPANILLDDDFACKVGDFGICRFLDESSLYTNIHKGIPVYTDPEFFSTGELTPLSDVYSFGIIILRLLTGKPANGVVREAQEALNKGYVRAIIDPSAGAWPFVQAKQLVHLGLRCCDKSKWNRPDLVAVSRVVEPMMKAAFMPVSTLPLGSFSDENYSIPSYFICPIFQEIMKDPHMAADGFTYEAEAIRGWIEGGHDTSPMTNLQLHNRELIPNRALRSAIQEWLQQQQQQQES